MCKLRIIIAAAIAFTFACNSPSDKKEQAQSPDSSATQNTTEQKFNIDTTKLASGATYYQCEMHPEVISDKPGNCPKCSMALVEINKK